MPKRPFKPPKRNAFNTKKQNEKAREAPYKILQEKPFNLSVFIGRLKYSELIRAAGSKELVEELVEAFKPHERKLIPRHIEQYGIEEIGELLRDHEIERAISLIRHKIKE